MPRKPKAPATATDLRHRAERRIADGHAAPVTRVETDTQRLLHELEVHQIELEMQNAELRLARDEAESVLEKYTDLYEFAPVGYFTLDPNGTILMVNLTGSTLVGLTRSSLVGRAFGLLVAVDCRSDFSSILKQVFQEQTKRSIDCELAVNGQPPKAVNIEVQRSPDSRDCRAVVMDITARKQSEEVLRRNQALFSTLIEQAPIGVYVVDASFRLLQANSSTLKVFGEIEPLIGRDFSEIVHILWSKRVADQTVAHFRRTLKTGEPYHSPEFAERRRDSGEDEIYEWQIQRVTLPAGEFAVVCFFMNITERVRAASTRRNLEILTDSNLKLNQEIARRQAVEEALHVTEQAQSLLLKQSVHQQEQLRGMSHQILQAQEDERKRISRELHDVIAQTLVGISVHVAALAQGTDGIPRSLQLKIARTHRLVEKSVELVHRFARELRPTVLDDLGLIPALHAHLKSFMEDTGIRVSLKAFAGIEKSPAAVRTVLYRVAQEALVNVARHANASQVEVSIQNLKGTICLEITDNGEGFEFAATSGAKSSTRLGLLGMKERVEMVGGTFTVVSAPGHPTTIRVEIAPAGSGAAKRPAKPAPNQTSS
jgi:PAS domain S-box-containing protein